ILSSFDSVRREIAKVALERLMEDGRIQPQRIEEIVAKTKEDINKLMRAAGEKLCHDIGVYNLPAELVDLIGRFKYRYSYGQNLIQHTQEETQIGIALAKMIGADANIVRLGCLLHDIGKVVEGDEGTHVEKGVQLAKKFSMPDHVINCIAEHHEDKPFSSIESVITYIADAISGARPGARHENVEDYIKRMGDIEKIATSFEGVEKAFAVSAGREVRVIVIPEKVPDDELPKLVHDIAESISKEVMVPGAVKITAIRETRYSENTMTT
ncbi:MAG: HDIG domain-containing metalloprotein, partial [Patescibacteria group bacterium]